VPSGYGCTSSADKALTRRGNGVEMEDGRCGNGVGGGNGDEIRSRCNSLVRTTEGCLRLLYLRHSPQGVLNNDVIASNIAVIHNG
jgi:hypothetical protein